MLLEAMGYLVLVVMVGFFLAGRAKLFFALELFAGKEVAYVLVPHSSLPEKCGFIVRGLVRHFSGNLQLWGLCTGCNQDFQSSVILHIDNKHIQEVRIQYPVAGCI